jgi:hypothetical protein
VGLQIRQLTWYNPKQDLIIVVPNRPWKDHLKSDLRSDQDHLLKKDLRSDQDHIF